MKGRVAAAKPSSKRRATVKAGLSNKFVDHEAEVPKQQVARKRTGRFPRGKPVLSKPDNDIKEISDHDQEGGTEEVEKRRKRKGKAKATEQDEVEEDEPPVENKTAKKRKATSDDDDQESVEIIENPKLKRGARAASQGRHDGPAGGKSRPPNSRAASRQRSAKPVAEDEAEENGEIEGEQPAPKKKRKINLFQDEKGTASVLASVRVSLSFFLWQF